MWEATAPSHMCCCGPPKMSIAQSPCTFLTLASVPVYLHPVWQEKSYRTRLFVADFWSDFFLHFRTMSQSLFLILLLPMALGQTSLRGREVKVTTVAHRPFIMPNNLSSGERWPQKLHKIVHLVSFPQIWRLPGWYDDGALNYAGFHFQHPR